MIKSKTNQSSQHYDASSFGAEIIVLQGSTQQVYYVATKTYEDDRTLVPLILYADMQSAGLTSKEILSGIEWYDRPPMEGDYITGRIVNPDAAILDSVDVYDGDVLVTPASWRSQDYLISDGSNRPWCSGVPEGALIIRKNIPAKTSVMIYAIIKGPNPNTGLEMRVQRNTSLTTSFFDDTTITVSGSWGRGIAIDPLSIPEPLTAGNTVLDEPWWRQVTAQIHGVEGDVAAAEACYHWVIADDSELLGYRQFTDEEKAVMQITGETAATLRFDARLVGEETTFRCYGCRLAEDDEWTDPLAEDNPYYETTIVVRTNDTLEATPRMLYGAQQGPDMMQPCAFVMDYRYNNRPVPPTKAVLLQPHWKGYSLRTGIESQMGTSPNLLFHPATYGFSFPDGFAINADVAVYAGCAAVVSGTNYVTDTNGNFIISPTFD